MQRMMEDRRMRLEGFARGLPDLDRLIGTWNQRLDTAAERLGNAVRGLLRDRGQKVEHLSAQIKAPRQILRESERLLRREADALSGAARRFLKAKEDRLEAIADRFQPALVARPMRDAAQRLTAMGELLESLSFHRVLDRGYAVVRDAAGRPVAAARSLAAGDAVSIEFADGAVGAQVTGGREAERKPQSSREKKESRPPNGRQGRLL
jgi:exodeoxyribonuclease VII large subunit